MRTVAPSRKAPTCARLTLAQQALISTPEALDLVDRLARHFARRAPGKLDDYRSAGQLGLIRAALKSDPDHPGRFLAYAGKSIRWAILREMSEGKPAGFKGAEWSDVPVTISLDLSIDDGPSLAEGVMDFRETDPDLDEEPMQTNGYATNRTNGFHSTPKERQPEKLPRGVRYDPKSRKWVARILQGKVRKHLGSFASIEAASAAYEAARASAYGSRGSSKPEEPVKPRAKPGPKPRVKDVAEPSPKGIAIPKASPSPAPSNDPISTAEAILAISKILCPLDALARKAVLQLAGQICDVVA